MVPNTSLQTLPAEVLLLIGDELKQEHQALMSLSCKRFYALFRTYFDISLDDTEARVRCLRLLEHDHPEYLTCDQCGWMFDWQKRALYNYQCPHTSGHSRAYQRRAIATLLPAELYPKVTMSREIVDLIARAYHRGLQHGILLSTLAGTGNHQNGISRSTEARWVDNQLLLATTWTFPARPKEIVAADQLWKIDSHVCLHWYSNIALGKWSTLGARVKRLAGQEEQVSVKCCFCATDSRIHFEQAEGEQERIVLRVWQNFGSQYNRTEGTEEVLRGCPESQVDPDALEKRDLRAMFESEDNKIPIATSDCP